MPVRVEGHYRRKMSLTVKRKEIKAKMTLAERHLTLCVNLLSCQLQTIQNGM